MSLVSFLSENSNNILALALFLLIALFVFLKRKKFSVEGKVIFIYRTKIGLKLMKSLSKYKRAVNAYSTVGVIAAVVSIFLMIYLSVPYLSMMFYHPTSTIAGASLVLPVSGVPGVIGVPILYWFIAIILVVTLHEASHGVVALSKRIRLKSSGFGFFLGILPLAFVEPYEKIFAKAKRLDRLRVLSAGSFTNIIMGLIALGLFYLAAHYLLAIHGFTLTPLMLKITNVTKNQPAYNAGLPVGALISKINGKSFYSPSQAESLLSVTPGEPVNLTTSSGATYSIKTIYNPKINTTTHSYIGVEALFILPQNSGFLIQPFGYGVNPANGLLPQTVFWLGGLFFWVALIALGIGLVNFLPIFYITDGCKIVNELLGYVIKDKRRLWRVTNAIIIAFSVLLLLLTPLGSALFSAIR